MRRQVLIENKSFLIEREKMKMKIKKPSTPALGIELGTSRLRTCIALYVLGHPISSFTFQGCDTLGAQKTSMF